MMIKDVIKNNIEDIIKSNINYVIPDYIIDIIKNNSKDVVLDYIIDVIKNNIKDVVPDYIMNVIKYDIKFHDDFRCIYDIHCEKYEYFADDIHDCKTSGEIVKSIGLYHEENKFLFEYSNIEHSKIIS